MADFSHLFLRPEIAVKTIERGYRVTDERWLGICERITPSLLPPRYMHKLRWLLDPAVERRGAPSLSSVSTADLVRGLQTLSRDDVPPEFLMGLIERVESGRRYTKRDDDRAYHKRWRKFDRDQMIHWIYREIYDSIDSDTGKYVHPILGPAILPRVAMTRSERAIGFVSRLLAGKLVPPVPAESTIRKILSEPLTVKFPREIVTLGLG